jgi:predicted thioesterase
MEHNLKEGLTYSMDIVVDANQTANFYGSGSLDVYATPAMIALMENTAKNCVQKVLQEGFTTVGIEVNIKHIKATPLGMKVEAKAYVEKVEGKKLYFKVEAFDERGKIGEGTHIRYIVNSEDFMKRIIG